MKAWSLGLAIIVTITGTSHGDGKQVGYPAAPPAPPDGQYAKLPAYPTAPADPWRGVSGDQPKRWTAEAARHWVIRGNEYDCSAARDHCLDPDAWFVVRNSDLKKPTAAVGWEVFGADGMPASAGNARHYGVGSETEWTAFRTVPATKANIAAGFAVVALDRSAGKLTSGVGSHDASWIYGIVDEVDLDGGFYTLKDRSDTFKLWGARVVVLTWKPGGKVQIVGGKKRDQLAVKPADVFKPD
jgi:hypothetical protein